MANFLLLYHGGSMPESEAEQAEVMKAWEAWFGSLGPAVVDGGNPTTPTATHVDAGGKSADGPVGEAVSGYSIIAADSLAAATELARGCPVLSGGASISVYETFPVM